MRYRILTILGCAAVVATGTLPAAATSAGGRWNMDEKRCCTMLDSSGNANNGVPRNGAGTVRFGEPGRTGAATDFSYYFTGKGPMSVPFSPTLVPGTRSFFFGVYVKRGPVIRSSELNLLQMGEVGQAGGQYKLELNGRRPSCYLRAAVSAGGASVRVTSDIGVTDSRWHRVSCLMTTSRRLQIYVDGVLRASKGARSITAVSPQAGVPLDIGGKSTGCGSSSLGCDYYRGYLDDAFVVMS